MKDIVSAAELARAVDTISTLEEKLREANAKLKKWETEIDVKVEIDGATGKLAIKVSAVKPHGGGGIIKTISAEEALYMHDSVGTLANDLARTVCDMLYYNQLREELQPLLARAVDNLMKVSLK